MSHGTKRNTQNYRFVNNRLSFHIAPVEYVANVYMSDSLPFEFLVFSLVLFYLPKFQFIFTEFSWLFILKTTMNSPWGPA
jgi:hypothetical protein